MKKLVDINKRVVPFLLIAMLLITIFPNKAHAESELDDPIVVVSLGDSYSSGEGIEPFYGQEKSLEEKIDDENWLAHRSQKSWPAQIVIPGVDGVMGDYNVEKYASNVCKWYFKAASGAETKHIIYESQEKKSVKDVSLLGSSIYSYYLFGGADLPKQIDVFDSIDDTVDYVTITIGGNDLGFASIIKSCIMHSTFIDRGYSLQKKIDKIWNKEFAAIRENIKNVYLKIDEKTNSQATILVAGYPKLFSYSGGDGVSEIEAEKINHNVTRFNLEIYRIVDECQNSGMNIEFVNVENKFDENGGHGAYADIPWINPISLTVKEEDISDLSIGSSYSVHPNEIGAQKYAECINEKIREIEDRKHCGTISGKICKAAERSMPIGGAYIEFYSNECLISNRTADSDGYYSVKLPVGNYKVKITSPGYLPFTAYATVTENINTYMETFLMVEGSEDNTGVATGRINSAVTGVGLEGVTLQIREGWNNSAFSDVIFTVATNASGDYSVTLPLGNYTMTATKEGYISTTINIVVLSGTTSSQNASMSPIMSDSSFRIVLRWGQYPRDLDSHVKGVLSDGNSFHVYYGDKSQYDGDIEVCNLDYDDTNGDGPETITLIPTSNTTPYYYYIYNYSGNSNGTVGSSGAQIQLYEGSTLIRTFNVPTDQGSERYWNVFAIVNGEVIVNNTITSNPDTTYASSEQINMLTIGGEEYMPPKDVPAEVDEAAAPPEQNAEEDQADEAEIVVEAAAEPEPELVAEQSAPLAEDIAVAECEAGEAAEAEADQSGWFFLSYPLDIESLFEMTR